MTVPGFGISSEVEVTHGFEMTERAESKNILELRNVVQEFTINTPRQGKRRVQAVSDVSLAIETGETLGLVGESGCGKSSLARSILQEPRPKSGEVRFQGTDLAKLRGRELRANMRGLQVVFQDPYASLDPRWRVKDLIAEPLVVHGDGTPAENDARVEQLLEAVGLDPIVYADRRPRELSGGQCQRVAIARALAMQPSLLLCDEAVSSLDVSVQAQILNLFEGLREQFHLSYLFITHDLNVARHVSDRIAVMYLGKVVEVAPSQHVFKQPFHPYTAALLSSIPNTDGSRVESRIRLQGDLPSPTNPPSGCRFRTRCPFAQQRCAEEEPPLVELAPRHFAACHYPLKSDAETEIPETAIQGR